MPCRKHDFSKETRIFLLLLQKHLIVQLLQQPALSINEVLHRIVNKSPQHAPFRMRHHIGSLSFSHCFVAAAPPSCCCINHCCDTCLLFQASSEQAFLFFSLSSPLSPTNHAAPNSCMISRSKEPTFFESVYQYPFKYDRINPTTQTRSYK